VKYVKENKSDQKMTSALTSLVMEFHQAGTMLLQMYSATNWSNNIVLQFRLISLEK